MAKTTMIPTETLPFPYTLSQGYKTITVKTLRAICPAAMAAFDNEAPDSIDGCLETEDLETIWVMANPPVCEVPYNEEDDSGGDYTETNEPELGEWLSENWEDYAVQVGDRKVVILCKTLDDEYGLFWDNKSQIWVNYNF